MKDALVLLNLIGAISVTWWNVKKLSQRNYANKDTEKIDHNMWKLGYEQSLSFATTPSSLKTNSTFLASLTLKLKITWTLSSQLTNLTKPNLNMFKLQSSGNPAFLKARWQSRVLTTSARGRRECQAQAPLVDGPTYLNMCSLASDSAHTRKSSSFQLPRFLTWSGGVQLL